MKLHSTRACAAAGSATARRVPEIGKCTPKWAYRVGDRRILEYAVEHAFVLVSTDSDFEQLLKQFPGAKVVILRSCDYPTEIAADVFRRSATRIAELLTS